MARLRQSQSTASAHAGIRWVHANAEAVPSTSETYDLVLSSYVSHELPTEASKAILSELFRVTRTGGCIAIADNNPRSKIIQGLPAPIFAMMKSTEPFSDQYYTFPIEQFLKEIGFRVVKVSGRSSCYFT